MLTQSLALACVLFSPAPGDPVVEGSTADDTRDWHKFQGPDGTGKAVVSGARFDWTEGGPRVLWSVDTGPGYGGAAVRDGVVYLLDREVGERDMLRAFALADGKELWSTDYEAPGRLSFPGSRTVPTVTEEHVYTCGGFGQVHAFDRESGEVVWAVDMQGTYGGLQPTFGWACSPLVVEDLVIVAPLGEDLGLVALDRFSGEDVWVTEPVGFSHSTPVLLNLLGEDQVVFVSTVERGTGQDEASYSTISSFHPADGSILWQHSTLGTRLAIPAPIRVDDEHLFLTGGYRGGSTLIRIQEEDGEYAFEDLWHIERGSQIQLPILYGEHLYVLVNENWNNDRGRRKEGGLLCLDLEGKEVWRTGADPFFGRGNMVLIGDRLVIQDGFDGTLRVAEATPAGYRQLAEANVFGIDDRADHEMWAPMAVAQGRLLARSQEKLLCVQLAD